MSMYYLKCAALAALMIAPLAQAAVDTDSSADAREKSIERHSKVEPKVPSSQVNKGKIEDVSIDKSDGDDQKFVRKDSTQG